MNSKAKILISGVGGQGVVFLTHVMVEAAMLMDIPVATSEIHGLSQRGGSVVAGLTLGPDYHGFIEISGADFLLGLEPLEAMRCTPYLHQNSIVILNQNKIIPYQVNAGKSVYPDVSLFTKTLHSQVKTCVAIGALDGITEVQRNMVVLGVASAMDDFPLKLNALEKAIVNLVDEKKQNSNIQALKFGFEYHKII